MPLRLIGPDGKSQLEVSGSPVAPGLGTIEEGEKMPRTDRQLDTERPDQSDERRRAREKGAKRKTAEAKDKEKTK
jgi:hypothetical protein